MNIGDLVRMNQQIPEYAEAMGNTVGLVVRIYEPITNPALLEVQWPHGEAEGLYTDELELVSKKQC
jgi:hypothetical protein